MKPEEIKNVRRTCSNCKWIEKQTRENSNYVFYTCNLDKQKTYKRYSHCQRHQFENEDVTVGTIGIKERIEKEIDTRRQNMVNELVGHELNCEYYRIKGMHDAYVDLLTFLHYSCPNE